MAKHCSDWEERLLDWAEAELPAAQLPELREHLQSCADCCGFARRLQVSLEVVTQGWDEAESATEEAVIMSTRAHQRATRREMGRKTRAWVVLVAAVGVLTFVGWSGWQSVSRRWASMLRSEKVAEESGAEQQTPKVETAVEAQPEARLAEIEAEIRRQEHMAILRALNQMWANKPGTEAIQASNQAQIEQLSRN
jgi:hypothetical protein